MFYLKVILLSSISLYTFAETDKPTQECLSTREFVTTLNFLKSKKELSIEDKKAVEIASFVSNGCTGAANRFIQTTSFLIDAEIPSNQAIVVAKNISQENDMVFNNFLSIFKKIYIEKYFDLPATKSLKMATDLTVKMKKDSSKVLEDFNALGEFCLNRNGLDLGFEKCSNFIFTILIKSKDINVSISKPSIEFYDFLVKEEKGPKLSTLKALTQIENIIEFGANGILNFNQAYSFATNADGLNIGTEPALKFAEEMAHKSIKKLP